MEQRAKTMEEFSKQQKSAEFLHDKIGQQYEATIMGVSAAQLVVEISKSGIRGRVLLRTLIDDRYKLNYNTYEIFGLGKGSCYKVGDKIQVRLIQADIGNGIISFNFI
jgi:ribonuclease R